MPDAIEAARAWFTAITPAGLAQAEAALLDRSAGPVTDRGFWYRGQSHRALISGPAAAVEAQWLAEARLVPGGSRCPALFGPLGAPSRAERIGHVELSIPIAHPTLDALVHRVPVLPPALRLPRFADDVWGPPPMDRRYDLLASRSALLARTEERKPFMTRLLEPHVDAILRGGPNGPWSAWSNERPDLPPAPEAPEILPYDPRVRDPFTGRYDGVYVGGVAFCGDDVVLHRGNHLLRLSWPDGRITGSWAVPAEGLVGVDEARRALILGRVSTGVEIEIYDDRTVPEEVTQGFTLDLRTGRWGGSRADVHCVWHQETLERSWLAREDGAATELYEVGDYPTRVAFSSADARFVWVTDKHSDGGVYRTEDAALVEWIPTIEAPPAGLPILSKDGQVSPFAEGAPWRPPYASALARRSGSWWTLAEGIVAIDGAPRFGLRLPGRVAAFAETTRLVIIGEGALTLVDFADGPRLLARWPLPGIRRRAQ